MGPSVQPSHSESSGADLLIKLRGRQPWLGTVTWAVLGLAFTGALLSPLPVLVVPVIALVVFVAVPLNRRVSAGHVIVRDGVETIARDWATKRGLMERARPRGEEADLSLIIELGGAAALRVHTADRKAWVALFLPKCPLEITTRTGRGHPSLVELTRGTYTARGDRLLVRMRDGFHREGPMSLWLPQDVRNALEDNVSRIYALTDGFMWTPPIEVNEFSAEAIHHRIDVLGWIGTRFVELRQMDDAIRALHILQVEDTDAGRVRLIEEWGLGAEDWVDEALAEWALGGDGYSQAVAVEKLPDRARPRALVELLEHPPANLNVFSFVIALCAVDVPSHLSEWMLQVVHRELRVLPAPDAHAVAMDIRQPPELLRPLMDAAPSPANAAQLIAWALLLGMGERSIPDSWFDAAKQSVEEHAIDALELAAECVERPALRAHIESIADHVAQKVETRLRTQIGALGISEGVVGAEWSIVEET